jgi:predicted DNA-binding transcriptional regulator YafY
MAFERSLEIARRLDDVLHLIHTGRYSTPKLAEEVGVSIPTISRIVAALRLSGHDIRAENQGDGWRYVLAGKGASGNDRAEDSKTKSGSTVSKLSGHK